MKRRHFIENTLLAGMSAALLPLSLRAVGNTSHPGYYHLPAASIKAPKAQVPLGKRTPFGWDTFVVPAAGGPGRVTIQFEKATVPFGEMRLRLCSVMDIREEILINVHSAASKLLIGSFDIRYPHILQPFELLVDPSHHADVLQIGRAHV